MRRVRGVPAPTAGADQRHPGQRLHDRRFAFVKNLLPRPIFPSPRRLAHERCRVEANNTELAKFDAAQADRARPSRPGLPTARRPRLRPGPQLGAYEAIRSTVKFFVDSPDQLGGPVLGADGDLLARLAAEGVEQLRGSCSGARTTTAPVTPCSRRTTGSCW